MKLLSEKIVEKPWGKDVLPPQFEAPADKRIGEVWFEPPAELSEILIKYIFTSEKLSVQVHPSDEQAAAFDESDRGKEECWLVVDAEPSATLGIGFREPVGPEAMRSAALDGTIEDLMEWFTVKPGDFFYIPAGTVHAIGAGVALIEVQQNSDITYRLYDYGRPRELHLEKGIQVAKGTPLDAVCRQSVPMNETVRLVDGPFFSVDFIAATSTDEVSRGLHSSALVVPIVHEALVGDQAIEPGKCGIALSGEKLRLRAEGGTCLLVQRAAPRISSAKSAPPPSP